jgi:hypothetical protein
MFVAGQIHNDLVQPGRKLALPAKLANAAIDSHKRVLCHFRGILVVAKQLEGDVERALLVAQHQIIKRRFIARPAAFQQFSIACLSFGVRV